MSEQLTSGPGFPAKEKTILEVPESQDVLLGDMTYRVSEIRPADMPALFLFIDQVQAISGWQKAASKEKLEFDLGLLLALGQSQPIAVCQLLAAVLDPDPAGHQRTDWQKQKANEFYALPLTQLTQALGVWIQVNANFFARQVTPLVLGAAVVMEQVNLVIQERLALLAQEGEPSNIGNA